DGIVQGKRKAPLPRLGKRGRVELLADEAQSLLVLRNGPATWWGADVLVEPAGSREQLGCRLRAPHAGESVAQAADVHRREEAGVHAEVDAERVLQQPHGVVETSRLQSPDVGKRSERQSFLVLVARRARLVERLLV